ncbi:hypothetical protein C8R42DRAFT_765054 [Lentinula raphanica]|nr:hypothetical protein C8R42DRAFT_765054 [Lentinula raphanica]
MILDMTLNIPSFHSFDLFYIDMRSSVMNLAFFVGLSMFTLSTCRPMPGAGTSKPGTFEPEPGVSLKSDSTWMLVNPEGVQEPTGRLSSPTPDDTEHQLFASSRLTKTEKEMVNAAKEFGDQTNQWDGYKFKINWVEGIPVKRDGRFVSIKIRSSASTPEDGKNIRGEVNLTSQSGKPRGNILDMIIWKGEKRTPGDKEMYILPGEDGDGEFAETEEGKITVIPNRKTKS